MESISFWLSYYFFISLNLYRNLLAFLRRKSSYEYITIYELFELICRHSFQLFSSMESPQKWSQWKFIVFCAARGFSSFGWLDEYVNLWLHEKSTLLRFSTIMFSCSSMRALKIANHNCINYINDHAGEQALQTVIISSRYRHTARNALSEA